MARFAIDLISYVVHIVAEGGGMGGKKGTTMCGREFTPRTRRWSTEDSRIKGCLARRSCPACMTRVAS